jgi:hypothetical protein
VPLKASRIAAVVIADVQPACESSKIPAGSHNDRYVMEKAVLGSLVLITMVLSSQAFRIPGRLARLREPGR